MRKKVICTVVSSVVNEPPMAMVLTSDTPSTPVFEHNVPKGVESWCPPPRGQFLDTYA